MRHAVAKGNTAPETNLLIPMKFFQPFFVATIIASKIAVCKATCADDIRLVEAIAQVESGGDDLAVGPATARGERAVGRYQMLPSTWADRTDWPVAWAHEHHRAQVVAVAHIQWLRAQLEKRLGQGSVTNYHLCVAWRHGVHYTGKYETREQFLERNQYCQRIINVLQLSQPPKHAPLID